MLSAGVEFAFTNSISGKLKYNYMDFGTRTYRSSLLLRKARLLLASKSGRTSSSQSRPELPLGQPGRRQVLIRRQSSIQMSPGGWPPAPLPLAARVRPHGTPHPPAHAWG
jgi:hypothetical protein